MLSEEEVKHIARLARVGLDPKEIEKFRSDLSATLDWFSELEKANISESDVFHSKVSRRNACREDVSRILDRDTRARIVSLFPHRNGDSLSVKSVF